ncbi:hypothetical protein [Schaalia hyovaginalis]|uniref:hypothetical protein n=1 Tax=Schaalia hyovaginalis TaxID=29316 RepID=UPI002A754A68|nr:hypothetical protein [Schaalia hyovaginalis]MDY2669797.1 hypothetical protein [Schaalia hyovaginalis]
MSAAPDSNSIPAKMIVRHGNREWLWGTDDTALLAAIDVAFRRRLAMGETVFFASISAESSGRSYASLVIPPDAFVQFSYTDFDGDTLTPLAAQVEDQVERFGGIMIGPGDTLIPQE